MIRRANIDHSLAIPVLVLVLWALSALAQEAPEPDDGHQSNDPWGPLRLLEGAWEGAIDGRLGSGKGVRRYEFIMDGKFLMSRHISVRLPQPASPGGDEHEELGVFSYDSEREAVVLREFMGEGVVIRSPCTIEGPSVVCVSEAIESGPGISARLTLTISDRYHFTEKYEIAWSEGQQLEHYFSNEWTRVPRPAGWQ